MLHPLLSGYANSPGFRQGRAEASPDSIIEHRGGLSNSLMSADSIIGTDVEPPDPGCRTRHLALARSVHSFWKDAACRTAYLGTACVSRLAGIRPVCSPELVRIRFGEPQPPRGPGTSFCQHVLKAANAAPHRSSPAREPPRTPMPTRGRRALINPPDLQPAGSPSRVLQKSPAHSTSTPRSTSCRSR